MTERTQGQEKATDAAPRGLYVHVPFCASTCDFCAFYQTQPTGDAVRRFLAGVEREAELVAWPRPVTTVFWGGGTPGMLAADTLRRLGEAVLARCGGRPAEWTVELAPASVTAGRLAALRETGVTRVSMGAQSFQPRLLEALGRQHTREQIHRAYGLIRDAGFASVNLDLIFAAPGQSAADWAADLAEVARLAPDHVSTYCLTFEEDTALFVKLSQGKVKRDTEKEARFYEAAWAGLAAAGYQQYEISNFARPGHACRHNLNTWRMHEWVGLGPSAASQHDGWRGANVADLEQWLAEVAAGRRLTAERTELTPRLLAEDSLIFGLRMNEGVNLAELGARFPSAPWAALPELWTRLANEGLLKPAGETLRLTARGRLLADGVGAAVMEAFSAAVESCAAGN